MPGARLLWDMRFRMNPASSPAGRLVADTFLVVAWLECDLLRLLELLVGVPGKTSGLFLLRRRSAEVLGFNNPVESLLLVCVFDKAR